MDGISAETMLGALVGLAVAGVLAAVLFRTRVLDLTFDERQQRARGTAYKYAFIATLVLARPGACGMPAALEAQLAAMLPGGVPALLFPLGWWIWLGLTALAGL